MKFIENDGTGKAVVIDGEKLHECDGEKEKKRNRPQVLPHNDGKCIDEDTECPKSPWNSTATSGCHMDWFGAFQFPSL